jgi:hypothetical protein
MVVSHFSLKQLLLAVILVGNGVGMLSMMFTYTLAPGKFSARMFLPPLVLWFLGGMSIGAGIFVLCKKPWHGALCGLAFQFVLLMLLILFGQNL